MPSVWFRVDCDITTSPKVGRLADTLRLPIPYAGGLVTWVFAAVRLHRGEHADLSDVPDNMLETWAQWPGKRGVFALAFRREFCDASGVLAGWADRQAPLIQKLEKDRERKRAAHVADENSTEIPRSFHGVSVGIPPLQQQVTSTLQNSDACLLPDAGEIDDDRPPVRDDIPPAVVLTSALNRGVRDGPGEPPNPVRHDLQTEATAEILAAGVDVAWAANWIYHKAKGSQRPRLPRSLRYFVAAVTEAWGAERDRRSAAAFSPGSPPVVGVIRDPLPRGRDGAGMRTARNAMRATAPVFDPADDPLDVTPRALAATNGHHAPPLTRGAA